MRSLRPRRGFTFPSMTKRSRHRRQLPHDRTGDGGRARPRARFHRAPCAPTRGGDPRDRRFTRRSARRRLRRDNRLRQAFRRRDPAGSSRGAAGQSRAQPRGRRRRSAAGTRSPRDDAPARERHQPRAIRARESMLAEQLLAMLNAGLYPPVPEQGSVGASGDLAPLAHLALSLIGEGNLNRGERVRSGGRHARRGRHHADHARDEGRTDADQRHAGAHVDRGARARRCASIVADGARRRRDVARGA